MTAHTMALEENLKSVIRDIPDFPKEGILFKDITPILAQPELCKKIVDHLANELKPLKPGAIACIESRGFFFGPLIAQKLNIPFVPIRKAGKLPYKTKSITYDLEYGSATIEMHEDALDGLDNIIIHDDLLATGGTAIAASDLIKPYAKIAGYSFLVDLTFLEGAPKLKAYSPNVFSLVNY